MRYIGNKTNLLKFLEESIYETLKVNNIDIKTINKFYDLFSGTGSVAEHFKNIFNVVGNDLLLSSYLITNVKLFSKKPCSKVLDEIFNSINTKEVEGFITEKYSEGGKRLYFSKENGKKIDGIRIYLEENKHKLSSEEYEYIIYCLLEEVHKVSNTTGVYGAYLKKLSSNALNVINIKELPIINSTKEHKCYNLDCIDFLEEINENDIIYIDPPYNSRQYGSNYHLLETIVKYDNPDIKILGKEEKKRESVSGLPENLPVSKWCSKVHIKGEIKKILSSKSKYIFMSYNTEGLITEEEIKQIFENYGTLTIKRVEYKRYKSNKHKEDKDKKIEELLFCLIKKT